MSISQDSSLFSFFQRRRNRHNVSKAEDPIPTLELHTVPLFPRNWTPSTFLSPSRLRCYLVCNATTPYIGFRKVRSDVIPALTSINTSSDASCLKRVIATHCYLPGKRIPSLAHYVRFGKYNLTLDAFLSVVSVARFAKPCLVLFHTDVIPHGPYWRALLHLVPNILHVQSEKPTEIFGHKINVVQHSSDVKRLRLLIEYGGYYLDNDFLVLRSLDDLLNRSAVLGLELKAYTICNAFIMSEPNSTFMRKWLANYTDFDDIQWAIHSSVRSYKLTLDHPKDVTVVKTFFKPHYEVMYLYYDRKTTPALDWTQHYGIHLYTRIVWKLYSRQRIDKQDNMIGDMVRHILYGNVSLV